MREKQGFAVLVSPLLQLLLGLVRSSKWGDSPFHLYFLRVEESTANLSRVKGCLPRFLFEIPLMFGAFVIFPPEFSLLIYMRRSTC